MVKDQKAPSENPKAFPLHVSSHIQYGMSLLDYMASQAMVTLIQTGIANSLPGETPEEGVARRAYDYAEAMLAERKVRLQKY